MMYTVAIVLVVFNSLHTFVLVSSFSTFLTEQEVVAVIEGVYSYSRCLAEAKFIRTALAQGKSLDGVPSVPIQADNITFELYTRNNPRISQTLLASDREIIKNSNFNANRLTVLYSPATQSFYNDSAVKLAAGLLPTLDINLIVLNWDSYSFFNLSYSRNVTAPRLAKIVNQFIKHLLVHGANPKQMYLAGFSTGAQIVGLAAKDIHPKISRILAIDPVGGCYSYLPSARKLTSKDADFVEFMHCSVGNRGVPLDYRGSVTFYIDGGVLQTPCRKQVNNTEATLCSHRLCQDYFFESLVNFNLSFGIKCDSFKQHAQETCDCTKTALMGFFTPNWVRGVYFVDKILFSAAVNTKCCASRVTWF